MLSWKSKLNSTRRRLFLYVFWIRYSVAGSNQPFALQHKTIEGVLERGTKLDDLVERSGNLSASTKMFYKSAKKVRTVVVSGRFCTNDLCSRTPVASLCRYPCWLRFSRLRSPSWTISFDLSYNYPAVIRLSTAIYLLFQRYKSRTWPDSHRYIRFTNPPARKAKLNSKMILKTHWSKQ